jgi:hypothetical protein
MIAELLLFYDCFIGYFSFNTWLAIFLSYDRHITEGVVRCGGASF